MPSRARREPRELLRLEMPAEERDLRSKAALLLQGAGLLHGSLIERDTVCGNATCKCARGERHHVLHLYRRAGGRLRQLYVPRALEETARRWVAQDNELRDVLARLWDVEWEKFKAMKRRK